MAFKKEETEEPLHCLGYYIQALSIDPQKTMALILIWRLVSEISDI